MSSFRRFASIFCLVSILGTSALLAIPGSVHAQECTADGKAGHYEDPFWDGTGAPPDKVCVPDGNTLDATGVVTSKTSSLETCQDSGLIGGNFSCALAWTVIGLFSGLISLIVAIMLFVEGAFDAAIQYTVVDFGRWFSYVEQPVQMVWTMARDIGNILIIGIFVFIAISIILGMQEYGQKKLIARVVIVSVLINFSFLFTIIVINTSNLFATQMYELAASGASQPTDSSQVVGLGNAFVNYLGVKTTLDTSQQLIQLYNQKAPGATTGSYVAIFKHAFFIFVFFTATTIVFFYGALLLFGRFIVLIILLMVSASVFALYLMPSLSESVWGRWKNALIQNSFLAPIMFFFIWASMLVAKKLAEQGIIGAKAGQASAFGEFATNQLSATAWQAAFGMILMLGLLGLGMYIANQIASGMAQRFASGSLGLGGAWSAGVGAWAGRNSVRRFAGWRSDSKKGDIKEERARLASLKPEERDYSRLNKLIAQQKRAENLSKRTFDARHVGPVGSLIKASGVPESMSKGTKQNYDKDRHDMEHTAVETAMKAAMSKGEAEGIAKDRHKNDRQAAEVAHDNAKNAAKSARESASTYREQNSEKLETLRSEARAAEKESRQLERQMRSAPEAQKAAFQQQINEKSQKIKEFQDLSTEMRRRDNAARAAESKRRDAAEQLAAVESAQKKTTEKILTDNVADVKAIGRLNIGTGASKYARRFLGDKSSIPHHVDEALEKKTGLKGAELRAEADRKKAIDDINKPAETHAHETKSSGDDHKTH